MDTARGAETHPGNSSDEDEQFLGEPGEGDRVLDDLEDAPEDGEQPMSSDDEDEENAGAGSEEAQQIPDDAVQVSGRHAESVFAVAWNQVAESTVASGGGDDKAFLFQAGGDSSQELGGHTDSVACLTFSADGTKLATGGLDGVGCAHGSAAAHARGPGRRGHVAAMAPTGECGAGGIRGFHHLDVERRLRRLHAGLHGPQRRGLMRGLHAGRALRSDWRRCRRCIPSHMEAALRRMHRHNFRPRLPPSRSHLPGSQQLLGSNLWC